jgi:cytochrome oxidase Cu insertion factor (SCO1/SenC/PrrC family)
MKTARDSLRVSVCGLLLCLGFLVTAVKASVNPFDESLKPLAIGDQMPAISLVDQRKRSFTFASARGQAVLVGFIYTRCNDACPLITQKFGQLDMLLGPGPYRLIEVTIDPEHDTQPVLSAYAKKYNVTSPRWSIVTGDPAAVARFVRESGVSVIDNGRGELVHSARLLVVTPDGRLSDVVQLAAWEPKAVAAQLRFVAGATSNPLARLNFSLTKAVAQLCGGSYQVASGIIDVVAALAVVVAGAFVLLWMRRRLYEQGA